MCWEVEKSRTFMVFFFWKKVSGGDAGGETPVPIPNTEVKPLRADDTMTVRLWESRSPPDFFELFKRLLTTKHSAFQYLKHFLCNFFLSERFYKSPIRAD